MVTVKKTKQREKSWTAAGVRGRSVLVYFNDAKQKRQLKQFARNTPDKSLSRFLLNRGVEAAKAQGLEL